MRSSTTARSRRRNRARSAMPSISTILPPRTVNPMTETGRPPGATTTPAAPFTSAGRTNGESRANIRAWLATASAPRTSADPAAAGATVGAQHDVGIEHRNERVEVALVAMPRRTRRQPRAAARCRYRAQLRHPARADAPGSRVRRVAVGVRPTIGAISSNGTANMSCSTNASRSAGGSISSTTRTRGRPSPRAALRVQDRSRRTRQSQRGSRYAQALVAFAFALRLDHLEAADLAWSTRHACRRRLACRGRRCRRLGSRATDSGIKFTLRSDQVRVLRVRCRSGRNCDLDRAVGRDLGVAPSPPPAPRSLRGVGRTRSPSALRAVPCCRPSTALPHSFQITPHNTCIAVCVRMSRWRRSQSMTSCDLRADFAAPHHRACATRRRLPCARSVTDGAREHAGVVRLSAARRIRTQCGRARRRSPSTAVTVRTRHRRRLPRGMRCSCDRRSRMPVARPGSDRA